MSTFGGGCLCGAIRYAIRGEPVAVAWCHCSLCRRSSGAPAVAWAMFPDDAFEVVAGSPAQYASTAEARRGFCPSCGTQMTFTSTHLPGFIDVTVGSFDAPESVRPTQHIWDSSCLPWMRLADGLPRHSGSPPRTA